MNSGDQDQPEHEPTLEEAEEPQEAPTAEAERLRDQVLRLQAELENQRKRFDRELTGARRYGLEDFARALFPVKDSLEHGLTTAAQDSDPDKLREGTELTLKMLTEAMERFGIQEIDPVGERFDPEYHEAMSMQPAAHVEPNTVLTVYQKGYLLNERLLRPARVVVSTRPEHDEQT